MSTPYQKLVRRAQGTKNKPTKNNYQIHKISFDDSDDSSRIDIPNIFLNDRDQPSPSPPKRKKLQKEEVVSVNRTESQHNFDLGGRLGRDSSPAKRKVSQSEVEVQPEPQQQIVIGESDIEPNSSLSLLQIVKLNLGEYLFRNFYPMKKIIYINNNNDYENELNMKGHQLKNNSEKEIIHFSNSLKVSNILIALALIFRNLFGEVYIYCWVGIILLQYLAQSLLLKMLIQYGTDKVSMIVILIIAILLQLICDWLSFRKRNKWQENNHLYRIYYNNGEIGQWINTKATQIKAGNIYKISKGETFPTDCVLLYSEHSLLQINERNVVTQLTEHPSEIVLKQTAIKGEIILPISGCINYEITNPEYSDFQVLGKLNLQQPTKAIHGVGMDNIVLRGSYNASDVDIICLALETGIDSFFLKGLQYPLLLRKNWQYSRQMKSKRISNQVKQEIKEYESRLQGCNLQKKVQSIILFMLLFYFLLVGVAILARFGFSMTTSTFFYTSSNSIPIWQILIYHMTNYIIIIPVLLLPIFKLYIVISGTITENNISKRSIQLANNNQQEHRRTSSLIESGVSVRNQQLLDNQKIIFPLTFKDYNLIPELSKIDTIITTIDTFRDNSAYTLHSIRVKEINHNFMTNSIDSEAMSIEDIKTMKYFMQVALLTTTKADSLPSVDQSKNYDQGIEQAAKKYFNLKKNKNAMGQTIVGDFLVRQMFHIKPIYEFPYKVVFLQAVKEQQTQDNKRILVLIRGNPKVILDKCYGKQVKYTQQSRQLQDKKGFHVQLVAKLTLHVLDAIQIQKAYTNNTYDKKSFYKNLDKYISKVESMGLLVFVNQFHQKKIGDSSKNPILNKSIINFSTMPKFQLNTNQADVISSQMMPNIIIIAPPSKSQQPVFQSIHTITNLLINPYIFHLGISEIGSKILHEKPNDLDSMFNQLQEQKILVWNGWDQKDILYTVDVMKKYGRNLLFYYQKDQYMYLSKQTQCSVSSSSKGFDSEKYSDINFTSRSSVSFLYLLQLIKYDSEVVRQGLLSILLTQIGKYTLYFVIEIINIFYTQGTALMVIKSPLFLVIQVVLCLDVLYYLNWDDTMRAYTFSKGHTYFKYVGTIVAQKLAQGIFITLICLYSTQTPSSSDGTTHPYQYSYFLIAIVIAHILVLQKFLNTIIQSISVYKAVVILVQVILIYLGFRVVSGVDKYFYYGILWNALSSGNLIVTGIVCIWICLTVPALRILKTLMRTRNLKLRITKKQF